MSAGEVPSSRTEARGAQSGGVAGAALIHKAADILKFLVRNGGEGARLSDVAASCELHKATAHRILSALCAAGLAEQLSASRRYRIDSGALCLSPEAFNRFDLAEIAQLPCARLSRATGDTVFLSVRRGYDSICVDRYEGEYPIKVLTLDVGSVRPLGVGAGSLALLSALPDAEVDEVIEGLVGRIDAYPSYSPEVLRDLVVQARADGFAFNDQMIIPRMSAIGVPVRSQGGLLLGSISIATISSRMDPSRRREVVALIQAEAKKIAAHVAANRTITDIEGAPDEAEFETHRRHRRW